ncbi:MAG: bestrophin family protein [Pirellulales bacterium]
MTHLERKEFWTEVFTLHNSVTPSVKWRIAVFGFVALIVWAIGANTQLIPTSEVAPYELIGAVLAVLLMLRTNAGYDRWYEGRKLWGGIVNQSRNLAQIGLAYGPRDRVWRDQFVRWTAAFSHACRHSLRAERNVDDLKNLLGAEEADAVAAAHHMPMYVSLRLAKLLHEALDARRLDRFAFMQAEQQRNLLIDHVGACERILKTPLAKAFSVKIRRFLFLYLVALPFGIFDKTGIMTPVIEMLVAYPLLSLDQIGVELQNPFSTRRLSHLPLDDICQTIQDDLLGELAEETTAGAMPAAGPQLVA